MRYRYYFCERYQPELVDYLIMNKIKYEISKGWQTLITFSILSTTENSDEHLINLKDIAARSPLVFAEYTASEYAKAKLLVMTPKSQYFDISNHEEAFRYDCTWINSFGREVKRHEEQIDILEIHQQPKINTQRAFWCESTGFSVIFADYRIVELVKNNSLSGIDFKNVKLKNGTYSDKLFQMTSSNILDEDCIVFGYGEKTLECPVCKRKQYAVDTSYQLHLNFNKIQNESDLYVTKNIFGEGIAYPTYIVSQRFYKLIKDNKLAGGIAFEPVAEHD